MRKQCQVLCVIVISASLVVTTIPNKHRRRHWPETKIIRTTAQRFRNRYNFWHGLH